MTKLKPVIMESSIFMISSFFWLRASISARVISRDSMKLKSSLGFLAKVEVDDVCRETDTAGAKPCVNGAMAPRTATRTSNRRDNMVERVDNGNRKGCCCEQSGDNSCLPGCRCRIASRERETWRGARAWRASSRWSSQVFQV